MISTVIIAKNEEKDIEESLKSVSWCDEVLVIDDYSEDRTVEIAKKYGAKIFPRHLNRDFAAQRNFGLEKARGEWVLFVDADERVSPALRAEIFQKLKSDPKYNGFYLKRTDFFGGRQLKHGETSRVKLLRLGRRKAGKWQRNVHEIWEVRGEIGELKNSLIHLPHPTISEFLREVNFYSTLHAQSLDNEKVNPGLFRIIFYPLGKFIQNYFLRLGFLDGMPGLIVALMMSFHSFLAQGKLFLQWKK